MKLVGSRTLATQHGVTSATIRRWSKAGKIQSRIGPGGRRVYPVDACEKNSSETSNPTKRDVAYCRVSSRAQLPDLERQIEYIKERFPGREVITDVGSGLNFKRTGLRTLVERAERGELSSITVAYRDRLCRFAFDFFAWYFQRHRVELVVLHESLDPSERGELCEDLLAIITIFSCRINGRRSYAKRTKRPEKAHPECKEQASAGQHDALGALEGPNEGATDVPCKDVWMCSKDV